MGAQPKKPVKVKGGLRYFKCTKCKVIKVETDFNNNCKTRSGKRCDCRSCQSIAKAEYNQWRRTGRKVKLSEKKKNTIKVNISNIAVRIKEPVVINCSPFKNLAEKNKFMKNRLEMIRAAARKYQKAPVIECLDEINELEDEWVVEEYTDLGPDDWGL